MTEAKPRGRRPTPRPEDFPHRIVETIRFGDLDRQNHINNAVFATHFESGRVIILYGEEYGLIVPDASFVLAHLSIDFLGEMHWPGEVEIGMTQISEILPYPGAELAGPLPPDIQSYTYFSAATSPATKEADAAKAFIKFLAAPSALAVIKAKGMEPG